MEQLADTSLVKTPDETRQRIITAARELVALKGTRGTTTREVAERAGVNEATLFRHFGTKANLLCEMRECFSDPAQMEHLTTPSGDVKADLINLGTRMLERLERNADLIRVSIAEEHLDPEGAEASWRPAQRNLGVIAPLFAHYTENGVLRGEPSWLARYFMGMFFAYVIGRRIWATASPTHEQMIGFVVDMFLNGAREKQ